MKAHSIASWPPSGEAGTVAAGQTVRLPAFSLRLGTRVTIACKSSQDINLWLEHGRESDTAGALPWGSEEVAIDNTYNTAGGGQPIYIDIPAGSEQAQVCLQNAGGADATARVDVGVE